MSALWTESGDRLTTGHRVAMRISVAFFLLICIPLPATTWANGFVPPAVADLKLPRGAGLPGAKPSAGFTLDWRKWTPAFTLFVLWLWTLHRVDSDAAALRIPHRRWNALLLGSGLFGFLLLFSISWSAVGYALLLLAYSVPVSLYVSVRNRSVPAERRVFSGDHLRRLPHQLMTAALRTVTGGGHPRGPNVIFYGKSLSGGQDEAVSRQTESSRGYRAAKELIADAVSRRATDIHLEPTEDDVSVRIRIDGTLIPEKPFDRSLGGSVINIFKVLSALDITDKRRSQDGSFRAAVSDRTLDFRIATQGTQHGEKLSLRILDPIHSLATLPALGMRKALQDKLRAGLQRKHGLFLVCGPTGSGKTTTLYAAVRTLDAKQKNIITIEDPIEYRMPGINQIEVNIKAGRTFAGALPNLLRQDPDVLLIGEIRDAETAAIACQAANTGHVVLSTLHANNSVAALYRLLELGVEPYVVSNSIAAVVGQRLARRLCPDCKEGYPPDPQLLDELGLPADKVTELFRPSSKATHCQTCLGTGYQGRVGLFEYLEITSELREMLREKTPAGRVLETAREQGFLSLSEEGLGAVARGIISLEEWKAVVGDDAT